MFSMKRVGYESLASYLQGILEAWDGVMASMNSAIQVLLPCGKDDHNSATTVPQLRRPHSNTISRDQQSLYQTFTSREISRQSREMYDVILSAI